MYVSGEFKFLSFHYNFTDVVKSMNSPEKHFIPSTIYLYHNFCKPKRFKLATTIATQCCSACKHWPTFASAHMHDTAYE